MELTSKNVETVFKVCLFEQDEIIDNRIKINGIKQAYDFNPIRLEQNKKNIETMLSELPVEFHANGGGGWSFLNACDKANGEQWTGMHFIIEHLFCLGMAIKKVDYLMPRELWKMLPGGVPYLVVK